MDADVEIADRRRVVVAALPLTAPARARLEQLLVTARVADIREPVERADIVLAPSCSPQTVAALKNAYPTARLVVVELEDWEFGIDLPGPVRRLLDAGADGYLTADSLDELADHLAPGRATQPAPINRAAPSSLPRSPVDEIILSSLADKLELPVRESR